MDKKEKKVTENLELNQYSYNKENGYRKNYFVLQR